MHGGTAGVIAFLDITYPPQPDIIPETLRSLVFQGSYPMCP